MSKQDPQITLKTRAADAENSDENGADGDPSSADSTLNPPPGSGLGSGLGSGARASYSTADGLPLLGLFAVGFGLLGIFTIGPVFVPLALLFGVVALLAGQILWGLTAILLALAGVLSSPTLMLVLGLSAMASWMGFSWPF